MNPSPSPDLIDSLQSFTPSTSDSSSSIINSNVHRYSRSALIQLRSNSLSRKRPECGMLIAELLSLGVWKGDFRSLHPQQNGSGGGNDTAVVTTSENICNNSSTTVNMNSRGHRSPSARKHLSSVIFAKSESPSSHNGSLYAHPNQKSYIDHRNISSAHLMPAFAKRRIGVLQVGSSGSSGSSNPGRPVTPNDSHLVAKDVQYTSRLRGDRKDHLNDHHRSDEHSSSSYISPQRQNFGDYEKDRPTERVEANQSSSASPSSALSSARHNASNSGNERRIGSGRLLHCDVNWDYRNSERENVRNPIPSDKEVSSHHYPQRSSARFSDRAGDRPNYVERRVTYDRRNNDTDREKFESRNNNLHTGNSSEQNTGQQVRTRRHHYNDRNDEPEWFSGGPISQNDTIELHGFDEIEENYSNANKNSRRKVSESSSSRTSSNLNLSNNKSKDTQHCKEIKDKENDTLSVSAENTVSISTPNIEHLPETPIRGDKNNNDGQKQSESDKPSLTQNTDEGISNKNKHNTSVNSNFTEFNFDAFLNMDPLNHSLMGADMKSDEDLEMIENSRFSRWFVNKSNQSDRLNQTVSNESSKESSDPRETQGNIVNDLISPTPSESQNIKQTNTLMQFLQRSRLPPSLNDSGQPQVVMPSVEELEARMHKIHSIGATMDSVSTEESQLSTLNKPLREVVKLQEPAAESPVPTTSQDTEAFKKLLEQLGSANKPDHSHLNDTPQHYRDHQIPNKAPTYTLSSQECKNEELRSLSLQHDFIYCLRHMQSSQQHLAQHMSNESLQALDSPMAIFAAHKRIFSLSLTRGEIKIGDLEQELNNPNTAPYAKEVMATVLREHSRSVIPPNSIPNIPQAGSGIIHKLHSPTTVTPGKQHSVQQQQGVLNHGNFIASPHLPNTAILPPQPHSAVHPTSKPGFVHGNPRDLQFYSQIIMENVDMNNKSDGGEKYWKRRQDIEMHKRFLTAGVIPRSIQMKINQKNLQHQLPESLDLLAQPQSSQPMQTSPQQQHSSHAIQQLQQRHINSPTPLAFTPTSVLRKMTAEKDNSTSVVSGSQQQTTSQSQASTTMSQQRQIPHHQIGNKNMQSVPMKQQQKQITQQQTHQQVFISNVSTQPQASQQPRMILGGGNHQPQQVQLCNGGQQILPQQHSLQQQPNLTNIQQTQQVQKMRNNQQLKWPLAPILSQQQQMPVAKPIGRPILKGPLPTSTQSQQKQHQQQQMSPMSFASRIEFQQIQQQQKIKMNPTLQHLQHQQQPQFPMPQQQPPQANIMNHAVQQHLFQQQQRAAALQRAQHMHLQQFRQLQPPQQLSRQTSLIGSNATQSVQPNIAPTGSSSGIINYQRDGGLSPTSNQLAQWFSPELLAQASAGKLPLLNMNQALSLEEFERSIQHSSTAVQN